MTKEHLNSEEDEDRIKEEGEGGGAGEGEEELEKKCMNLTDNCNSCLSSNPSLSTCKYKKTIESNDYENTNSISFGSSINGIPNPIVFQMDSFAVSTILSLYHTKTYTSSVVALLFVWLVVT